MNMQGKICLITGASSGIGRAAATDLAKMGATVVLGCRNPRLGQEAVEDVRAKSKSGKVDLLEIDLASFDSIRRAVETFKKRYDCLHVLINNAGVWQRKRELTREGFEMTFGVNHLGHFLLTQLLLDRLKAGVPARIVNVSSALHASGEMNWDDLQLEKDFGGQKAYCQSKLANVLFTRALVKRLPPGITANSVHPGVIATRLLRNLPWVVGAVWQAVLAAPEEGGKPLVYLASAPELSGITGKYFDKMQEKRASEEALDDKAAERLWELSEQWTTINSGSR